MATKDKKNGNGAEEQAAKTLPVFYREPQPITLERHTHAGINTMTSLNFTKDTNSVPVTVVEFFEAARNYPIVFTAGENPLPIVLIGIEPKNYFLNPNGQWARGCYVPAYVRRYPFILMEVPDMKQWVLCVDEAAPHFTSMKPEEKFYDAEGKPSQLSQNALEFCRTYQAHYELTEAFSKAVAEAGLLEEKVSEMTLPDQSKVNLHGFQLLSEEKFHALPEKTLAEWQKKGWVGLVYAVLMSYNNWKYMAMRASDSREAA